MSLHDFGWALAQMRDGQKVRRPHWGADEWITIRDGKIIDEDGGRTNFSSQEPLTAVDWELSPS